jgi:hypothetical protein
MDSTLLRNESMPPSGKTHSLQKGRRKTDDHKEESQESAGSPPAPEGPARERVGP